MPKFIQLLVMALLSPAALAVSLNQKGTLHPKAKDCESILGKQATPLDYAISDYEGLFLDLVQKVQSLNEMPPDRHEYLINEVLNLKAQVLNRTAEILPFILRIPEQDKKVRIVASVYQVLDSLGVPPQVFGLKIDDQRRLVIPVLPALKAAAEAPELAAKPIGFLTPSSIPSRDLPVGVNRSIGFTEQTLRSNAGPKRQGGFIQRGFAEQNKNVLIVADGETKAIYYADLRILTSGGAQLDGKTLQLNFNPEIGEWMIEVKNLNNPNGKIGFR